MTASAIELFAGVLATEWAPANIRSRWSSSANSLQAGGLGMWHWQLPAAVAANVDPGFLIEVFQELKLAVHRGTWIDRVGG